MASPPIFRISPGTPSGRTDYFSQFLLLFFLITVMLIMKVSRELASFISGMLRSQQRPKHIRNLLVFPVVSVMTVPLWSLIRRNNIPIYFSYLHMHVELWPAVASTCIQSFIFCSKQWYCVLLYMFLLLHAVHTLMGKLDSFCAHCSSSEHFVFCSLS